MEMNHRKLQKKKKSGRVKKIISKVAEPSFREIETEFIFKQ